MTGNAAPTVDVWAQLDSEKNCSLLDPETVEAEIVFLARCAGQWPECQTEIYFHPSLPHHMELAASIWEAVTGHSTAATRSHSLN